MVYVFTRSSTMQNHRFSDDVAIVRAASKEKAIKKFSRYYADIKPDEVYRIRIDGKVGILTDY